jgi:ribosomal 50S subunit-recycling heat shock protein
MDKWLWAARFFKTRALAARACELGRIERNGQSAKASREVRVGDLLQVKNDAGMFQIQVLLLSQMRGPPPLHKRCISRRKRAANYARNWQKSVRESRVSRHYPKADRLSVIVANLKDFAVEPD